MVSASTVAPLEVRAVGSDDFEAIYPLLLEFKNRRMSRDDWREMVFTYRWSPDPLRGFALYAHGIPVGFMGTIFSDRPLLGRTERLCNASCWIVRPEYRTASILLLKPLLGLRDCTIVNLTPTQRSFDIFAKLGFIELESEQLLLPPVTSPAQFGRALGGSFTLAPDDLRRELGPAERNIYDELSPSPRTRHILLRGKGRRCYIVATLQRHKRVRFAELQYVGDLEFFWERRPLAHAAVLRAMGAVGIAIDRRFAEGRRVPLAIRRPARRSYRPARPEITPLMIDGLYSELMTLQT
jgi:hypothetical protein